MEEYEFNIGDKVKVSFPNGRVEVGTIVEIKHNVWCDIDFGGGCMAYDVTPDRIEPLIPISDEKIREMEKEISEQVKEFLKAHSDKDKYARYREGKWNFIPKEEFRKSLNPEEHRIDTPLQDLLAKERWESYRRAVAGQIAIKMVECGSYSPKEIGEYAVEITNLLVKYLKDTTI